MFTVYIQLLQTVIDRRWLYKHLLRKVAISVEIYTMQACIYVWI